MSDFEKAIEYLNNKNYRFDTFDDMFNEEHYLDSGSFGAVYGFDDTVIKVIYSEPDYITPKIEQGIFDEGDILKAIQHIGLTPKVFEYTEHYIVMEKVEGKPLWCLKPDEAKAIDIKHYIKLIEDLEKIIACGYRPIDVSTNNVFWCGEEVGFRVIDVGLYIKEEPHLIHLPVFFSDNTFYSSYVYPQLKEKFHFDLTYDEIF